MNPKARAMVGVVTTVVFSGVAISLAVEQRYTIAAVVAALSLVRAYYAFGQVRDVFFDDDEEDEDEDEA